MDFRKLVHRRDPRLRRFALRCQTRTLQFFPNRHQSFGTLAMSPRFMIQESIIGIENRHRLFFRVIRVKTLASR